MDLPKIKIQWSSAEAPKEIKVQKLKNGYVLGDIFCSDKKDLSKLLFDLLEDPYADITGPKYERINPN